MQITKNFEYPLFLEKKFERAKKLEKITFFYFLSASVFMALVMGNSQTMKTAWIEDVLSLIPPICFLIASKIYTRPSNSNFPYGYHRVISIAFLISSVTLFAIGSFLLVDSLIKLIKAEHPTLNMMTIFNKQIWIGYPMIIVLMYSTIPSMLLGKMKKPISHDLFEKNLMADAKMNKADWLTGIAGVVGIAGISIGWWWADSVAAIIISFDILFDGFSNVKQSVLDLMNQIPKLVDKNKPDPIFNKIKKEIEKEQWVKSAGVRFRQEGHVYFGEAFIVPANQENILDKLENTKKKIMDLNWRIFDFTITLVKKI